MIQIADQSYALTDPAVLAVLFGAVLVLLIVVLLLVVLRRAGKSADLANTLAQQMGGLGQAVQLLGQGQEQLTGGLRNVSDSQSNGQTQVIQAMETRLAEVQRQMQDRLHANAMTSTRAMTELQERMNESLQGSTVKTTQSLTQLQERLATIDKAQENITRLSDNVLSLQDILSDKQARGAFGEIQLHDIVNKALPSDSFALQATLSNGKRADCLIHLPNPPGPIVIDSKFPLEAYVALRKAETQAEKLEAARAFKAAVRVHIKAISEKYIIEGETADGALMFLPSEAIYAELHANFSEIVREGFEARVWIVSPTTCMATLNTMRAILKDARMREQAGAIRKTLRLLHRDVELVADRVDKLNTHFGQARSDLEGITTAAERAGKRAAKLDNFDFEELADADDTPQVVPLAKP